jgi:MFS transporter, YNFM family, putative membrane transport protein
MADSIEPGWSAATQFAADAALPIAPARRHALDPVAGVVGVFVCGAVAFLTLYATQPLLPLLESLFHASKSAVGWTVSASTLGVAIAAPLLGTFAERLHRKRVIVACILLLVIPTCACASAPTLDWLIFWRLLQGLITPGIFATTIAYITECWPPTAVAPVMSLYVSGTALGGFCGRTATGLLADALGWRAAFLVLGGMTLVGAVLVAWLLPYREHGAAASPGASLAHFSCRCRRISGCHRGLSFKKGHTNWISALHSIRKNALAALFAPMRQHLRNRPLLITYLVGFNVLFSLVGVFTYITFYLAAPPFSLSSTRLSELFAVYLVGLVATPLAGALLPRVGLRNGISSSLSLSLAGVLLTLSHTLAVVIFGLAMCCTGVFISQSCATSFLRVAAPEASRASAVGLYVSSYYIGGTMAGVAPSLAWNLGVRWNIGGWTACAWLIATVDVLSLLLARYGWRQTA